MKKNKTYTEKNKKHLLKLSKEQLIKIISEIEEIAMINAELVDQLSKEFEETKERLFKFEEAAGLHDIARGC